MSQKDSKGETKRKNTFTNERFPILKNQWVSRILYFRVRLITFTDHWGRSQHSQEKILRSAIYTLVYQ